MEFGYNCKSQLSEGNVLVQEDVDVGQQESPEDHHEHRFVRGKFAGHFAYVFVM